jgi:hypothetical protein
LWIGLLLLTVLAALWPMADNEVPEGTPDRTPAMRRRDTASHVPSAQLLGPLASSVPTKPSAIVNLFPPQTWAPATSADTSANSSAPALPFSYGGRYTEGDHVFVFLNEGTQVHTARQGDTVKGSYRIDKIDDAVITLTYLPLGVQQNLLTSSMTPR